MNKVFVSSVMREFSDERAAARNAIDGMRMIPVMAEDFGARPHSPQIACLEQVRSSSVFVLILGKRYGFVAESGLSASEEEFIEAQNRGLAILVFRENVEFEPRQQEWLDRIASYEYGYSISKFATPFELQTQLMTALHDIATHSNAAELSSQAAVERARRLLVKRPGAAGAAASAVVFPSRSAEEYVSPIEMGTPEFEEVVAKRALFGQRALFNPQEGYKVAHGREHVRFAQLDRYESVVTALDIHADGTVVWYGAIGGDDRRDLSLLRQHVINQESLLARLTSFLAFSDAHFAGVKSSPLVTCVYVAASLSNIAYQYLGKWPEHDRNNSIQIPMSEIDDPLIVPATPMNLHVA